ncbi:MAG: N-6 DNA methylase, partial [Desulfobacterales bacterium]|nr:N-6 DNA methylase [Desulfobacterales bacterium]
MNIKEFISCMNYDDSPFFLSDSHLYEYPGYAHIFRLSKEKCGLHGVYTLKTSDENHPHQVVVPIVYICQADSEQQAREFHRLIWNQNIVPFIIVLTTKSIHLYSGFNFNTRLSESRNQSILEVANDINVVLERLSDFKADSIDRGILWQNRKKEISQDKRVDRVLLRNLNSLSSWLRGNGLSRHTAHSLIGKYVYLYYLQDRKILSDRKLEQWFIDKEAVFGRKASLEGFYAITDKLEGWLNGDIFPIPRKGEVAPEAIHIQKVAAVFLGDDPDSGQMNLDFKAYDFEHIPIETLSVVYQQFLHSEGKGKKQGAIYTPIHLVNFILDELDAKRPFRKGMKGFDPACGSGAFLVQCYRRLIERELAGNPDKRIKPSELRSLLTDHIYGMDVDEDACGITELSLILTLLDYVEPPDLEKPGYKTFKLPALRNRNIFFCKDGFFKPDSDWEKNRPRDGFDWIVGNPPWKKINKNKLERGDSSALDWMEREKKRYPVSSRQIAEAFAWEITRYLSNKGLVGMLLPAGTLFKTYAKGFRQQFFSNMDVWCIVNFSNLRHLLFQSSTNPAVAFFYSTPQKDGNDMSSYIVAYAPFAAHQLSRFGVENRKDNKLWTVIVNADEIREISKMEAATGSSRPWKLAMWGSVRDKFLLNSLEKRYDNLLVFAEAHGLVIHEGLQLRSQDANEPVELIREVIGKNKLDMSSLRECGRIFSFPEDALKPVEDSEAYVRKRGGLIPLKICYPPHIIVDAARRFGVFSDEFIVVPPRQIGISAKPSDVILLKTLSLYLSSDFTSYHQFLSATFWGIERDRPTKEDLGNLPIPLDDL